MWATQEAATAKFEAMREAFWAMNDALNARPYNREAAQAAIDRYDAVATRPAKEYLTGR